MKHRLGVLLVLFTCGCSIVDPGDRDELRDQIAMISLEESSRLKTSGMNSAAIDRLKSRPEAGQPGDQP